MGPDGFGLDQEPVVSEVAGEHHGLVVDIDDDEGAAGPSTWPARRTSGEECSRLSPAKEEPPSDDDNEDDMFDYAAAMYRRLGIGRGRH